MISLIRNDKGENLFKIKYYGADNVLEYKFDTDPYSYGYALISIAEELDIDEDKYADADDKQYCFIDDASSFSDLDKLVNADLSLNLDKKIAFIQKHIDKFCNEWGMTHEIAE